LTMSSAKLETPAPRGAWDLLVTEESEALMEKPLIKAHVAWLSRLLLPRAALLVVPLHDTQPLFPCSVDLRSQGCAVAQLGGRLARPPLRAGVARLTSRSQEETQDRKVLREEHPL